MKHNFPIKQKILSLCLRWHILRSYCFVAEVTFNGSKNLHEELLLSKNETDINKAKLKDLENWKKNNRYVEIDNEGQR